MLIRATIVLLVVLNLGVAAWWLWRPSPAPETVAQPPGVPRLVLLEEIVPARDPAAVEAPARERTQPPVPAADPAPAAPAAAEAVARRPVAPPADPEPEPAAPLAGEPRCEGAGEGEARGWRVYLPPAADLAAAEATAGRIAAAGFSDYLVLRDGAHANGIALGMFSGEAGAQRRAAALRNAGFPARCARIPVSTPA